MKGFIIVVGVAIIGVQAFTEKEMAEFQKIKEDCMAVSGVDPKLIFKGERGELVDDPKLKEYMFCSSKKQGFQNEAGQIQMDAILSHFEVSVEYMDEVKERVAICDIQKETPQQTTFELFKCLETKFV